MLVFVSDVLVDCPTGVGGDFAFRLPVPSKQVPFFGRDDEVGSIEVGKRADLIIIDGDLNEDVANIRKIEMVFKAGVGYDSAGLIESARGTVGIR